VDPILSSVAHRPWPLPEGPWVLTQRWHNLLFAHWPVAPAALRSLVPQPLVLDTYNAQAWVAVTPFQIAGNRARLLPPLPPTSSFPELNVRTYVTFDGKPGVYFFSLDAGSFLAALGARLGYGLPYFHAAMRIKLEEGGFKYWSRRYGAEAEFLARYAPAGNPRNPQRGSLEHFLTERYCLYRVGARGALYRADIHHLPWPLEDATASIERNTVASAAGIQLPDAAPLLYYAGELKVYIWPLRRVAAPAYVFEQERTGQVAVKPV